MQVPFAFFNVPVQLPAVSFQVPLQEVEPLTQTPTHAPEVQLVPLQVVMLAEVALVEFVEFVEFVVLSRAKKLEIRAVAPCQTVSARFRD